VTYGKAPQQFGDFFLPKGPGPHPAVIFIHGGFWRNSYNLDHAGHVCAALARAGAAVWSLEYRRLGDPGGDWAGMSEDIVHGAQRLVPLANQYNLDLKRVIAAGHSSGGHLALWLAAQQVVDLRGVVPLAAISDLRRAYALQLDGGVVGRLLGGSPDRVPQRYAAASPMELLPLPVPQRLLHGTADNIVPLEMSQRFAKASKNAKLITLSSFGHFELIDPRTKAWPTIQKNILDWEF
jgi:acetyl esterase/lipase